MEKHYAAVCYLACDSFKNAVGGGAFLPVKAVIIIYKRKVLFTKSLKFSLLRILSEYAIVTNGVR